MEKEPESVMLFDALRERAKELRCLYMVEEILSGENALEEKLRRVAMVVPQGWLDPEACMCRISFLDGEYLSGDLTEGEQSLSAEITVNGAVSGSIAVLYPDSLNNDRIEGGPFLDEERKLLESIARRIGEAALLGSLTPLMEKDGEDGSLRPFMEMLRIADGRLYGSLARRLLNYMGFTGVKQAVELLRKWRTGEGDAGVSPAAFYRMERAQVDRVLAIASAEMGTGRVVELFRRWVGESRVEELVNLLEKRESTLGEMNRVLEDRWELVSGASTLSKPLERALKVAMIRRFCGGDPSVMTLLGETCGLERLKELFGRVIYPSGGSGGIGGKASSLLAAGAALRDIHDTGGWKVEVPPTWYICTDALQDFISRNGLEELIRLRYRYPGEIRHEYPNLIELFRSCSPGREIMEGLARIMGEAGSGPLVVRGSSLLEGSSGVFFGGCHRRVFLPGGSLERLAEAVSLVYASVFGPEALARRRMGNLQDLREEIGIMIQPVVGRRLGRYFLPSFSGIAMGRSTVSLGGGMAPEDGLVRLVPGLGIGAMNRSAFHSPVLACPGKPDLRLRSSLDEMIRCSPSRAWALDMETGAEAAVSVEELVKGYGAEYPMAPMVFSVNRGHRPVKAGLLTDFSSEFCFASFQGLLEGGSGFLRGIGSILSSLERRLGYPVDIEFACDGESLYLLQCRPSADSGSSVGVPALSLPPEAETVLKCEAMVTDGVFRGVTHAVVLQGPGCARLSMDERNDVAEAVGKLNEMLPPGGFMVIGPGRWGSSDDPPGGVPLEFSRINKAALLVETWPDTKAFPPDLIQGTHFARCLEESSTCFVQAGLDRGDTVFSREFFEHSPSTLQELLPGTGHIAEALKVIDIPRTRSGMSIAAVTQRDKRQATIFLTGEKAGLTPVKNSSPERPDTRNSHWMWRVEMAEAIADGVDPEGMGVVELYLFGSAKNATSGPSSDIDLLVHFRGGDMERSRLEAYLRGWDHSLVIENRMRTGIDMGSMLDIHIVTDEDIRSGQSYAVRIGAISDPARPLGVPRG